MNDYKECKGDDAFKKGCDLEMEVKPSVQKFIETAKDIPNKKFFDEIENQINQLIVYEGFFYTYIIIPSIRTLS